jgi:hypothetical protein
MSVFTLDHACAFVGLVSSSKLQHTPVSSYCGKSSGLGTMEDVRYYDASGIGGYGDREKKSGSFKDKRRNKQEEIRAGRTRGSLEETVQNFTSSDSTPTHSVVHLHLLRLLPSLPIVWMVAVPQHQINPKKGIRNKI